MGLAYTLLPTTPLGFVCVFIGIIFLWTTCHMGIVAYKVRRLGNGVRAPLVRPDPLTSIAIGYNAIRAYRSDQLLAFFNGLLTKAPPHGSQTVEMMFLGILERVILTREPEHMETVLKTKFADFGKGAYFNEVWRPFLGDGIFTTDGHRWHDSRKLIRPMFSRERLSDLTIFNRWVGALMDKMPAPGVTVDMMDLLYHMAMDTMTDFLLGAPVGSLENPQHEFTKAFSDVQRIQVLRTILAPYRALVPQKKYWEGLDTINAFIEPFIQQALSLPLSSVEELSESDKNFTFLHRIIRSTRDPQAIRDHIVSVILASRDEPAATVGWALCELSQYPEIWAKLRHEVLRVVGNDRAPTSDDLKEMTYMAKTINETLRLYPVVPYGIRCALTDTSLPGRPGEPDIAVCEGDLIIYSMIAMHRRRDLYPEPSEKFADPEVFSPDRWEHWTPKPFHFMPFNGGPRTCLGQDYAMTVIKCCLVRLLQKYERLEYRGDWHAQRITAEVVGAPSLGVPVAFFEPGQKW